jgi:hypothetical protein
VFAGSNVIYVLNIVPISVRVRITWTAFSKLCCRVYPGHWVKHYQTLQRSPKAGSQHSNFSLFLIKSLELPSLMKVLSLQSLLKASLSFKMCTFPIPVGLVCLSSRTFHCLFLKGKHWRLWEAVARERAPSFRSSNASMTLTQVGSNVTYTII